MKKTLIIAVAILLIGIVVVEARGGRTKWTDNKGQEKKDSRVMPDTSNKGQDKKTTDETL